MCVYIEDEFKREIYYIYRGDVYSALYRDVGTLFRRSHVELDPKNTEIKGIRFQQQNEEIAVAMKSFEEVMVDFQGLDFNKDHFIMNDKFYYLPKRHATKVNCTGDIVPGRVDLYGRIVQPKWRDFLPFWTTDTIRLWQAKSSR